MGKYMTPEDATLAGNYTEWDEEEQLDTVYDECEECGSRMYDTYCDECEEYFE